MESNFLLQRCWHEAGHAIVGLQVGIRVYHVSVQDPDLGGTAKWDLRTVNPESETLLLLAGAAAQRRAFQGNVDESWLAWVRSCSRDDEDQIRERLKEIEPDPAARQARREELELGVDAMLADPQVWKTVSLVAGVLQRDGYVREELLRRIYRDHLGEPPDIPNDPGGTP